MKNKETKQKLFNLAAVILALLLVAVVITGLSSGNNPLHMEMYDGIEQIDLDTIYLKSSKVEVNFSDVILSDHNETRQLIVSTQEGTVSTELTDKLIKQLDFDFLKKTQTVSYRGKGYFVVDLDKLTSANIIDDKEKRILTIKIDHARLEAIEIDPNNIIIDEVKEGLLARGNIELTVADYNAIEKELRTRLENKFDTVTNGQKADDLAVKMVKEVYEPIVKAIDRRYSVVVEFK